MDAILAQRSIQPNRVRKLVVDNQLGSARTLENVISMVIRWDSALEASSSRSWMMFSIFRATRNLFHQLTVRLFQPRTRQVNKAVLPSATVTLVGERTVSIEGVSWIG